MEWKKRRHEPNIHRCGFECCNTRKKAMMTSVIACLGFGSTCDEKKLGQWVTICHLGLEACTMQENHNNEL